ncbi:MAG: nickel pincer cofactor biosynthesis protein LarC [Nitrospirae bacterium]|nr:nickel pincer cofactor biosynthesis protein LarC [Nitrospirota bacterium]
MSKHLHLDCFSGISGDMFLGALVDAGLSATRLKQGLKALPVDGYQLKIQKVHRGSLVATKVEVHIRKGYDKPLTLSRIRQAIRKSSLPPSVKNQSLTAFDYLAEAEGAVHGVEPAKVHFHEVGVIDSFVDVVGGILGCYLLGIDTISASPVNLGSGFIKVAHGTLPVPGPAVAYLAQQIPVYSSGPSHEMTTPTGLSVLKTLTKDFRPLPSMTPSKIGYGAGNSNPDHWPNVLRIFIADSQSHHIPNIDRIAQIETNVDDMNPQLYETVMDHLFSAGALDVTLTPVIMKRSRPGIILSVLTPLSHVDAMTHVLFQETSTLGVRVQEVSRHILPRTMSSVRLKDGIVRIKISNHGSNRSKITPEYQDCKAVAAKRGRPVREVMKEVQKLLDAKQLT